MPPAEVAIPAGSTRRVPAWLLLATVILLVARIFFGIYEAQHPPRAVDRMTWRTPAEAAEEFTTKGLPIFYEFSADWCGPCRRLEREVFANRSSARSLEAMFIPVRLTDRQREEGHNSREVDSLMTRFGVNAFPTVVIFDPRAPDHPEKVQGYGNSQAFLQEVRQAWQKTQMAVSARSRSGPFGMPGSQAPPDTTSPPGSPTSPSGPDAKRSPGPDAKRPSLNPK